MCYNIYYDDKDRWSTNLLLHSSRYIDDNNSSISHKPYKRLLVWINMGKLDGHKGVYDSGDACQNGIAYGIVKDSNHCDAVMQDIMMDFILFVSL
jgi:hypothetical protein